MIRNKTTANGNPSVKTLMKIAYAFGKKLKIEFVWFLYLCLLIKICIIRKTY